MIRLVLAAAFSLSMVLGAVAQAPDQPFTVTMPYANWQKVGDGLGELKTKDGLPTLNLINQQIGQQIKAAADKSAAVAPAPTAPPVADPEKPAAPPAKPRRPQVIPRGQ